MILSFNHNERCWAEYSSAEHVRLQRPDKLYRVSINFASAQLDSIKRHGKKCPHTPTLGYMIVLSPHIGGYCASDQWAERLWFNGREWRTMSKTYTKITTPGVQLLPDGKLYLLKA